MKRLKKALILILSFLILVGINSILNLFEKISFGNIYILYGFYFIFIILIINYIIKPIIKYLRIPSVKLLEDSYKDDRKAIKRLTKYYLKKMDNNLDLRNAYKNNNMQKCRKLIVKHIHKNTEGFDEIINKYALSVTTTVVISPNSLIDGLAVIISNIKMLLELSNKIGLRYRMKNVSQLYFKVFFASTLTGAIEEYDEVIEDVVEEILENIGDTTGTVVEKSPYINILSSSITPIIQASANYFFIIYNGYCYKNYFTYLLKNKDIDFREIKRSARKEARKKRFKFIRSFPQKFVSKTTSKIVKSSKNGVSKFAELFSKNKR